MGDSLSYLDLLWVCYMPFITAGNRSVLPGYNYTHYFYGLHVQHQLFLLSRGD